MAGILDSLLPRERFAVGQVLRRCPRVEIGPRTALAGAGLPRSKLLLVERGIVLLVAERPGCRRPVVLTVAGPGSVIATPTAQERIVALTAARVSLVPLAAYEELVARPTVSRALVEALLDAVRERQESLASATGGRHRDRLRDKLFQLARGYGRVGPDGVQIELPLTHELLAQMVGSARETVTASLARLEREGVLERTERGYRLNVRADSLETMVA